MRANKQTQIKSEGVKILRIASHEIKLKEALTKYKQL